MLVVASRAGIWGDFQVFLCEEFFKLLSYRVLDKNRFQETLKGNYLRRFKIHLKYSNHIPAIILILNKI